MKLFALKSSLSLNELSNEAHSNSEIQKRDENLIEENDDDEIYLEPLEVKFQHPRDKLITRDEEKHIYYVNNEPMTHSITGFKQLFFLPFDEDHRVRTMYQRSRCKTYIYQSIGGNSEYDGMTPSQIRKAWTSSASTGTDFHKLAEILLGRYQETLKGKPVKELIRLCFQIKHELNLSIVDGRISGLCSFLFDFFKNGWLPYRLEWQIYDEDLKLAGTIDAVFYRKVKNKIEYVIVDWKTVKSITGTIYSSSKCYEPFSNLESSKRNGYLIQLNMYAHVLKEKYNIRVSNLIAVCIENESKYKDFIFEIIDMKPAIDMYRNHENFMNTLLLWFNQDDKFTTPFILISEPFFYSPHEDISIKFQSENDT